MLGLDSGFDNFSFKFNTKIDPIKINAYTLTGRRGLYGLFPTQFKHPSLRDLPGNSQVNFEIFKIKIFIINIYSRVIIFENTIFSGVGKL